MENRPITRYIETLNSNAMLFCAMVYKTKQYDKSRKVHVANTQAQDRQQANKILKGNGSRELGVKEENTIKTVHQSDLVLHPCSQSTARSSLHCQLTHTCRLVPLRSCTQFLVKLDELQISFWHQRMPSILSFCDGPADAAATADDMY